MDYWGDFSRNAWSVHIHYWTGTIWYLFLISQPYMSTHGQLARHRTYGIIGIFFAGCVCLTALSMLHRDIVTAERALAAPEDFGPFQSWFFYGVAAVEIIMMPALGRGLQNVFVGLQADEMPDVDIMMPIYITQVIIVLMTVLAAWKYQKLRHPAT